MTRPQRTPLYAPLALTWACACATSQAAVGTHAAESNQLATRTQAPSRFVSPFSYEQFVRAELLTARGEHARAAAAYEAALSAGDDDPYLMARWAEALERSGDADGARAVIEDALAIDPRSEAAWLARARMHVRRGQAGEASIAYEAAAAAAPQSPRARLEQASFLAHAGHAERALAVLEALTRSSPLDARSRLRAELRLALGTRDETTLTRATRDWLSLGELDPELERTAARALSAHGRWLLASRLLERFEPNETDSKLRLEVALALGRAATAEALLRTLPPAWLGGPAAMAQSYLALGKPALAHALSLEADRAGRDPLIEAEALLALDRGADAALLLAREANHARKPGRGRQLVRELFERHALPALGAELSVVAE